MIYHELAGEKVSSLGLGNMRLPVHGLLRSIDKREAGAMIDAALDGGINYFDTAYFYHLGRSEDFLGDTLARYPRDTYKIATKYYFPGFPDPARVLASQLRKLRTDYIDFYLLHSLREAYFHHYFEKGRLEYLLERKEAGVIGHLGFSSHLAPAHLEQVASMRAWDFAQIQLNYYDWNFGSAREEYEILAHYGIPIVVMEPVRGGKLARLPEDAEAMLRCVHPDWKPAEWALRWVKRFPQVKVVLSGMSNLSQVRENITTFSDLQALTDDEAAVLDASCGVVHKHMAAPCTACGYCTETCPAHIDIPRMMDVYNEYRATGRPQKLPDQLNGADCLSCIGCGACVARCPQSIPIPQIMTELSATYNGVSV